MECFELHLYVVNSLDAVAWFAYADMSAQRIGLMAKLQ